MEQVYRRRSVHTTQGYQRRAPRTTGYRQAIYKQSLLCLLLFIGCLFINLSSAPQWEPVQSSLRLIVNTQTDFAAIPGRLHDFIRTHFFGKDKAQNLKDKNVLTALSRPVDAPVTSPFGLREHPVDGEDAFHYGVDLGASQGEKIKCAAAGTVVEAGESPSYGNYLLIQHSDEIYTLYAHCESLLPAAGDAVLAEQVIATVGATGKVTGPHLHFEIRNGETWLDPSEFIDFEQADHD